MSLVTGIDRFNSAQDSSVILKSQDPFANRQPITQARVLDQDRQTRSEIADTPVTEPARPHLNVTVFRHSKLRPRLLDKLAIGLRSASGDFTGNYFPATIGQIRRSVQGDAKALGRARGQIDEPGELAILLAESLTLVASILKAVPAHD